MNSRSSQRNGAQGNTLQLLRGMGWAVLALGAAAPAGAAPGGATAPAGSATSAAPAVAYGRQAFAQPAANLDRAAHRSFAEGSRVFHNDWQVTGSPGTARQGLGPHFAARSCAGCHVHDGRGHPDSVALVPRLTLPPGLPDAYGGQITPQAVPGVTPRGQWRVRYRSVAGRFADGETYTLRQPVLELRALGYGPLPPGTQISARLAPQLAGLGLLDAIDEADILDNERRQAALPGPVKGRANRVFEPFDGREVVGRFGWKASTGSLHHQIASAFFSDLGVTSRHFPGERPDERPELDTDTFLLALNYQFGLGVPARRNTESSTVRRGEQLFAQAQCAQCHRAQPYTTGKGWFPALSRQTIRPYTDLLLHDMGPGLADGRPDAQASGSQWRTPPLWGIGLLHQVNGHQRLLHDGRARGVLEAILWHGGEAQAARDRVLAMPRRDREALVQFVNSL